MNRRGTNPLTDLKLLFNYIKILKRIKPDVVLTYTIKPNVYGGIACAITKTPYITNITGLGTSVENKGLIQKITLMLYKLGLKKASCVFFQNETNRKFFIDNRIVKSKTRLIPGSGVNLEQHKFEEYPISDEKVEIPFYWTNYEGKGNRRITRSSKIDKREISKCTI